MSRLDELIKELCPEGVEWIPVGNLFARETKKANKFPDITKVYAVTKDYGIIDSLEYWDRVTSERRVDAQIFSADTSNYTVIRRGMFAYNPARLNIGSISYLKDGEDGLLSPMYVVFSIDEERIMQEYLLIFLKSQKTLFMIDSMKEEGARFRFDYKNWNKIKIPLPPLEIQREIVRILDQFSEFTDKLNAELAAELAARKKQYEYYANNLFQNISKEDGGLLALGELCNIQTGKLNANAKKENGKYPFFTCDSEPYRIDEYAFDTSAILISGNGSQVGHLNVFAGKFNAYQRTYVLDKFKHIDKMFLYYYMKSSMGDYILKNSKKGSVPYITLPMLQNFAVIVPSMEQQKQVAALLARFDALCNDLTSGLPTEIAARQRQYEYYRDKLLSFPATSSAQPA